MSDQPTDHRAQAEKALADADEAYDGGNNHAATAAALLGIGHALLAGIDVLAEDEPDYDRGGTLRTGLTTVTNDSGEAIVITEYRCTYAETSGGISLRCGHFPGHPGDHELRLNP